MFKGLIFFLKNGWKYDKLYIIWSFLNQIIGSVFPLVSVLFSKFIIDELIGEKRINRILIYVTITILSTLIVEAFSSYFNRNIFVRRCRVNAEFDSVLHEKLCECDYENLENPQFLNLKRRAEKFLYCDWHGFGYLLDCALSIIGKFITLLGSIAVLFSLDTWLIFIFLLISLTEAMVEKRAQKQAWELSDQISSDQRGWKYFSNIFEDFAYGKEIRLNVMGSILLQKERDFFSRVIDNLGKQNQFFIGSGIVKALLGAIRQIVAYGFLVFEMLAQNISIGSFTMYVSTIMMFTSALTGLMTGFSEINLYDYYFDDLEEYVSVPRKLRCGTRKVENKSHEIEFCHVSYKYPGSNAFALKDVCIRISEGQRVMIVGENGAGKTTFVKLLIRLYEPTEGRILLDGIDIKEFEYDQYMELFSTVFQDFKLFPLSIMENVALGYKQDYGRVEKIFSTLGMKEKLDTLPKRLDTEIFRIFDEQGFEPSGGEGQKIALARAIYKDAEFIILDEPTSALDPRAEFELYQCFTNLIEGKTAVFISHRLGSAKLCDRIVVFDHGKVVEDGMHDTLVKANGKYAELFSLQADYYTF